ncbi:MAG: hypothetical protein AAFY26_14030 [Cyanobacteria bacterium J06638_22]
MKLNRMADRHNHGNWLEVQLIEPLLERSGGGFSLLPAVPWGSKTFKGLNLLSDPHAQPLAMVLRERYPLLYAEWFHRVYNATQNVLEIEKTLERYKVEREVLFEKRNEFTLKLQESFGEMRQDFKPSPLKKEQTRYEIKAAIAYLLSPWLAPVLFHTMTELFASNLHPSDPVAFVVYPVLGGLAAAASVGAKVAVKTAVQNSYTASQEDQRKPKVRIERIFQSPVLWTMVILGAEIGFGAPFMIRFLDRAVRQNPFWQVAIVLGTSLGPSINMGMAWALGQEGARLSQQVAKEESRLANLYPDSHYSKSLELSTAQLGKTRMQVKVIDERVRELERQLKVASRRARIDYLKWLRKVERIPDCSITMKQSVKWLKGSAKDGLIKRQ